MRTKSLKGVGYEDSKIQDFFKEAINNLIKGAPYLEGNSVTVSIGTLDTEVSHGLGRSVQGWIITNKTGPGDIYQSASENKNPDLVIILKSSSSVQVTILFY